MRAVRALLGQIVDYAGLFPPARLPLDAALDTYLRHRASPHAWMLGRFVCPTAKLPELIALARAKGAGASLQLTALGRQSEGVGEVRTCIETDIEAIQNYRAAMSNDAVVDMFEVALPKGATIAALQHQLPALPELMAEAKLAAFLEIPFTDKWNENVDRLSNALHEMQHTQPDGTVGMKLRCGGVTADAFPSDEQVAFFIDRCQAAHLPWKATAGLHHPRRHFDAGLQLWHHGFFNVFAAGLFAATHTLTTADIVEILADRDLEFLRVDENCLAWKSWMCTTAQIAEMRVHRVTSFGSCSFDEPCQDLHAMGWLDGK